MVGRLSLRPLLILKRRISLLILKRIRSLSGMPLFAKASREMGERTQQRLLKKQLVMGKYLEIYTSQKLTTTY